MAVFVQYDFKFQIANIILAIICQSEDWGSEIFAYITSQDNFWSIFASCIVLRCGISWNMRKLLLQAILWFEAQVALFFSWIPLLWDAPGKSLSWQKWLNSFYNSTMTDDDDWLLLTISEVFEKEVLKKIGESGHVWFLPHQVFHCFSPIVCDRTRIYVYPVSLLQSNLKNSFLSVNFRPNFERRIKQPVEALPQASLRPLVPNSK